MAGHSKWANIQHRKGAQDARRGKLFTKLIREITVSSRAAGGDPANNPRLRAAMDKALTANMSKDTIERAIKKGVGAGEGDNYEEIRYEGYGSGGIAVMVDCLTDNRVRTVADVRHAFSKAGGNLGTDGSVAFQFRHCGQIIFAPGTSEEKVIEVALDSGADDVIRGDDDSIEVVCEPGLFEPIRQALDAAGLRSDISAIVMKPDNEIALQAEDAEKMQKLLDALEGLDDVQEVYTNASMGDS